MKKYKRGITFGAFDCLHVGHIRLLKRASEMCEELIVCVSTDAYMRRVKGSTPIIGEKARIESVSCIMDHLKKFGEWMVLPQETRNSKEYLVSSMLPEVIFVGDDWKGKDWDGTKLGIPVEYIPHTPQIHSTDIRKEIGIL